MDESQRYLKELQRRQDKIRNINYQMLKTPETKSWYEHGV